MKFKGTPHRIGVIDIGSNSVRFVVFDLSYGMPTYYFNEKVMCGLAARICETGRLCPEGSKRALRAIARFMALAEQMEVSVHGIATAAMRDAQDGPVFQTEIQAKTKLAVSIISGAEEARLSAQGVSLGMPDATGLVVDLGGGSLELTHISHGEVKTGLSLPYGILRFTDSTQDALIHDLAHITDLQPLIQSRQNLYLVGGSWRAIAKVHMARTHYPLPIVNDYRLSQESTHAVTDWILHTDLNNIPVKLASARLSSLKPAAYILKTLLSCVQPDQIYFSSLGLREGLLMDLLNLGTHKTATFLVACRKIETECARCPGFGEELYAWAQIFLAQVFTEAMQSDPNFYHRIHAACLLSDVSWRMHPDYRAQNCFDIATRIHVSGVSHTDRLWIGAALLHRHKGGKKIFSKHSACQDFATKTQHQVTLTGQIMRLGTILAGAQKGILPLCDLRYDETDGVHLKIPSEKCILHGETVDKHLNAVSDTVKSYKLTMNL